MDRPSDGVLAFAGPLVRAQQVWSALRGHGLAAWLMDQNAGNLYQHGDVHVVVPAAELAAAQALLLELGLVREPESPSGSQTAGST